MRTRTVAALLAASLLAPAAWGQAGHAQHHPPGQKTPTAKPAEKPPAKPAPGKPATAQPAARGDTYRSAFEGYRPFNPEEPVLDWREVNEAVREAGGHIGILKAAQPEAARK